MRKSRILKVAICSALVASLAATTAITAFAADEVNNIADIKGHKVGVCGVFTGWGNTGIEDIPMNDDDGDGIWTADVDLESVDAEWITEWMKDDKPTGEQHIQFKVRLDDEWKVNWATYEPDHSRVFDSQCNLAIKEDVAAGDHIKFTVFLDTNQNNPDAVAAYDPEEDMGVAADDLQLEFLYAGYKNFEKVTADAPAEEKPTDDTPAPAEEKPAEEKPADETPAPTPADTTGEETPATGDTTSAIALVAVVLASLGTAVVMTKKASAKD